MEYQIRPEPAAVEREAIVAALEQLLPRDRVPGAYRSAWRAEGVRENTDSEGVAYAGARPRSSPGATRA